jgi:hypothetical protein
MTEQCLDPSQICLCCQGGVGGECYITDYFRLCRGLLVISSGGRRQETNGWVGYLLFQGQKEHTTQKKLLGKKKIWFGWQVVVSVGQLSSRNDIQSLRAKKQGTTEMYKYNVNGKDEKRKSNAM